MSPLITSPHHLEREREIRFSHYIYINTTPRFDFISINASTKIMVLPKNLIDVLILLQSLTLLVQPEVAQSKSSIIPIRAQLNATNGGTPQPPLPLWLKRVTDPRGPGCWKRPWICNQGERPHKIKRLCCRNRCVEVSFDVSNCGLCGIRCPFTWQCCRGLCINTNINRFHCGRCDHKCPFRSFCSYGMCGYAEPLPPFPFPLPPHPPKTPHGPFPPHPPFPPKPPHGPFPPHPPFPPKPPHGPFPPHGPRLPPGSWSVEGDQPPTWTS